MFPHRALTGLIGSVLLTLPACAHSQTPASPAPGASAEISYELRPDTPGLFGYELTVTPSSGEKQVFVLGV